jgi:hypothetical protein
MTVVLPEDEREREFQDKCSIFTYSQRTDVDMCPELACHLRAEPWGTLGSPGQERF